MSSTYSTALPPVRAGFPAPDDVAQTRLAIAQAVEAGTWRTDPLPIEAEIAGVRTLQFAAPGVARAVVVHFHGGAYRIGCPEVVLPYAAALAAKCGVEVICPAYRLAPEYPVPAGLHDGINVVEALRARGVERLILAGESAGGGIAASVAAICVARGIKLVGAILHSPWLDMTVSSASYDENAATDPLFSRASAELAATFYLQGYDAKDGLASPLFAALSGFPPSYISIGDGEVLADDGRLFYAALRAADVAAELHSVAGMEHVAVTRGFELLGAQEVFDSTVTFINALLD